MTRPMKKKTAYFSSLGILVFSTHFLFTGAAGDNIGKSKRHGKKA